MEAQVNIPKWQAKFERSFPAEIISVVNNLPKSETTPVDTKAQGLNPWLVVGLVAIVGITAYVVWKLEQDVKKREYDKQTQLFNSLTDNYHSNTRS